MKMLYIITKALFLSFLSSIFLMQSLAALTYDVVQLGAKPDGMTDSKQAFQEAWNLSCGSSEPASIYVPEGTFLLDEIKFQGPCKNKAVLFKINGSIVAPDYEVMASAFTWIEFQGVDGVSIEGGNLDGNGSSLWDCKASKNKCTHGATTLAFYSSNNINITGLTSRNSKMFHIAFVGCQNVTVLRTTISAPGDSPNTDGIHVQYSADVSILHSTIGTGDDCISIGPGGRNLWIEDIDCGPGHGISIGSLGMDSIEGGVNNITVTTARFNNTQNGVRIKTWAKPSESFAENVTFQHLSMIHVQNPIIIDQNYCPGIPNCPHKSSGVKISGIRYIDIHGTSATEAAVTFNCSKTIPCSNLRLKDINLTCSYQTAKSCCSNAFGTTSGPVHPTSCLD